MFHSEDGAETLLLQDRNVELCALSAPFFSAEYFQKRTLASHLFVVHHALSLAVALMRETAASDAEQAELARLRDDHLSAEWAAPLCESIYRAKDEGLRRTAKRLLSLAVGGDAARYQIYDPYVLSCEFRRLETLTRASQSRAGADKVVPPYSELVDLHVSVERIEALAKKRPENWGRFVKDHVDRLYFLFLASFAQHGYDDAVTCSTLHLLAMAGDTEAPESSAQAFQKQLADFVVPDVLHPFIHQCLLAQPRAELREHARAFLYFLWKNVATRTREELYGSLCAWITILPQFGAHATHFCELMTLLLSESQPVVKVEAKGEPANKRQSSLLKTLFEGFAPSAPAEPTREQPLLRMQLIADGLSLFARTFCSQLPVFTNHPNGSVYTRLGPKVVDGVFALEAACTQCSVAEAKVGQVKLKSIVAETKHTVKTSVMKLSESYLFSGLVLRLDVSNPVRAVRAIKIYFNHSVVADITTLKNKMDRWTLAKEARFANGQRDVKVSFAVPFAATNLMIEFSDVDASPDGQMEVVECQRCSVVIASKHGICSKCRENVFQCRQCRNINYENLDGFQCTECGYSRFCTVQVTVLGRPCFTAVTVA
jgi:E3 ubiquitin-protein ligase UBR4